MISTRFKSGFGATFNNQFYSEVIAPSGSPQEAGICMNFAISIARPGFTLRDDSLRQMGWPGNLDRANWDPLLPISGTGTENDGIVRRFLSGHMKQTVTPDPGTWRHTTGTMTGSTQYEWLFKWTPYQGILQGYVYGDYGTNGFGPHSGFHLNSGTGVDPMSGWGEAGYYSVDTVTSDSGLVVSLDSNDRVTVQQTRVISMEFHRASDDAPFGTLSVTQVFDGDFQYDPMPTDRWSDLQRLYNSISAVLKPGGAPPGGNTFLDDGSTLGGGTFSGDTSPPDSLSGWGFWSKTQRFSECYNFNAFSAHVRGSAWVTNRVYDLAGNTVSSADSPGRALDFYQLIDDSESISRTWTWFRDYPYTQQGELGIAANRFIGYPATTPGLPSLLTPTFINNSLSI